MTSLKTLNPITIVKELLRRMRVKYTIWKAGREVEDWIKGYHWVCDLILDNKLDFEGMIELRAELESNIRASDHPFDRGAVACVDREIALIEDNKGESHD